MNDIKNKISEIEVAISNCKADIVFIFSYGVGLMYKPKRTFLHYTGQDENNWLKLVRDKSSNDMVVTEGYPFQLTYNYFTNAVSRCRGSNIELPQIILYGLGTNKGHFAVKMTRKAGLIVDEYLQRGVIKYFYAPTENVDDIIFGDTIDEVVSQVDMMITGKERVTGLCKEHFVKSFTCF